MPAGRLNVTDDSLFSLDGKIALITGGNGGLGHAIALGFRDFGARVAVTGRDAVHGREGDVVVGHVRSASGRGRTNERFILTGEGNEGRSGGFRIARQTGARGPVSPGPLARHVAPSPVADDYAASASGDVGARDGCTRRKQAGIRGSHQFQRPKRETSDGTSSMRTTVASSRIPAPRPVPTTLASVCGPAVNAMKLKKRIRAPLVTSRPVRPMARITAALVEPVASYSSRILARMKTS